MNFEKIYSRLPNFIKYNRVLYSFSLKLAKNLRSLNSSNNQLNSQNQLLNILFTNCDFQINGELRDIQVLYVELLRFIDNVCNKYEINYWIDYGTLLGAVRHGGFIPWDDDIDISVMREDYEKLIEVLPIEINNHQILKENCGLTLLLDNHENYFKDFKSVYDIIEEDSELSDSQFCFLQICLLKPYIKIDIFPHDYIEDDKIDLYLKNYAFENYKFNNKIKNGTNKEKFLNELNKDKLNVGQVNRKTNYCGNSLEFIIIEKPILLKIDDIFPLSTIKFDNYYFQCPKNAQSFLQSRYGQNYMKIPKIIEHHDVISFINQQFDSKEERDLFFKDNISLLKNINDNFR